MILVPVLSAGVSILYLIHKLQQECSKQTQASKKLQQSNEKTLEKVQQLVKETPKTSQSLKDIHQLVKETKTQTKKKEPAKNIYFVDVENVGFKHIPKILKDKKTKLIVMITSTQSKKFSKEIWEELSTPEPRIEILHSRYVQKELADKLLLAKVGEYKERFSNDELVINSRDKGFEKAIECLNHHWQGLKIRVIN